MRQPTKYIGLIFILVAIGCTRQTNDSLTTESNDSLTNGTNDSKPTTTDTTTKTETTDQKRVVTLIVKDSTKYSKRFLEGLRSNGPGTKFELVDNMITTDDHYKNEFPQMLPADKNVVLTATKGEKKYWLSVRQLNYTTISYQFKLTEKDKVIANEQGEADLSPGYMLGSSTSQDDEGNVYGCYDYFDFTKKCTFYIDIGDKDNIIKAHVIGCGDDLQLGVCPTLK